ncbi:hypothetical protein EUGRSUZ_B00685, partial [Eucalyptus grandis]
MPFDLLVVFLAMIPLHFASSETLPSTSSTKCHEQERSALLEFKQSFFDAKSSFCGPYGRRPKLESWKLEDRNCYDWKGVDCDEGTGYVIGLDLSESCLSGPINSKASLFRLAHLQSLNLAWNNFNYSQIPPAIGDLVELVSLNLSSSSFRGQIPSQLPRLQLLDLSYNSKLSGHLPEFDLGSPIKSLFLLETNFSGSLPASLGNLAFLNDFDIDNSNFTRNIPSSIGNLTQLTMLDFAFNKLSGEIPSSLVKLVQLSYLDLGMNLLSGEIPASLTNLTNLASLDFNHNQLTGQIPAEITGPTRLRSLDLSQNRISGPTPPWFLNVSVSQLRFLNLSRNSITKISPEMCRLSSIEILDLSKNKLSGVIPPCLSNLSDTLHVLSLNGNDLYGRFPQLQNNACRLNMIDVSDNQLQGSLPRGLANCSDMEFLNIENNQIVDTFPSWMGSLFYLKVLILRSNRFHGAIRKPEARDQFPNLRIVDLSMNNFSGSLPSKYFDMWSAMKVPDVDDASSYVGYTEEGEYDYSMTITNKGILMKYERIFGYLNVIDLSSNNFIGEISNSVGSLTELRMLNLSNNALIGSIPLSLANLTELESLDLSSNKLSGMIPPALAQLNFLAFFNVSDNHLSGPIPQVNQFHTFENNSYGGNLGLCGVPLTKKCGNPIEAPSAPPSGAFAKEIDWKIVLMGFGSGLVIGV